MTYDVHGWIEVAHDVSDPFWVGVLRIEGLHIYGDEVSGELFGLSKVTEMDAPFGDLGIPEDASEEVTSEFASSVDAIGATSARWVDLAPFVGSGWVVLPGGRTVLLQPSDPLGLLFAMAARLSDAYSPAGVRFVVWGTW